MFYYTNIVVNGIHTKISCNPVNYGRYTNAAGGQALSNLMTNYHWQKPG